MIAGATRIVASASPRRAEILRTVGWPFETQAVGIDESRRAGEEAVPCVERVACAKAEAAALRAAGSTILGADPAFVIANEVLGKPRDYEEARPMFPSFRGQW